MLTALAGLGSLTAGAAAAPVHVRGIVLEAKGDALTIKADDGRSVGLTLGSKWKIAAVVPSSIDAIKPGTFIGTANVESADGNTAIEVVVFPEQMRGAGEGNSGWDLKPNSAMTNATVSQSVEGVQGRTLTLSYKGGEKKVTIPAGVPIVMASPGATAGDVTPGSRVFASGELSPDGSTLTQGFLVIGKDGAVPAM